jgi:hypothetical protein
VTRPIRQYPYYLLKLRDGFFDKNVRARSTVAWPQDRVRPASRGTAERGDERQTVPVEHERLRVADNLVLVISLLGNPEIAEKTSHITADAVREPKRITMATRRGRAARSERRRISTNPVRSRWCGHRARG